MGQLSHHHQLPTCLAYFYTVCMKYRTERTNCIHAKSSLWVSHHNFFSQSVIKCEDLIDPMIIWHEILKITITTTKLTFQTELKYIPESQKKNQIPGKIDRCCSLVAYLSSVRFFFQCRLSDIYRWIILLFVRQKHKVEHTQYMRK